jgi:uncharacterized protein YndB with AHSA1/START domain
MPTKTETHAGISSDAVRTKTGKDWAEWFAILDKAGAKDWSHKEIAIFLHEQKCGDWWSQMVTVGYEQARGLRVKHQTADGFTAGASKTIAVPLAELFKAWNNAKTRAKWLPEEITIRSATANKSMRLVWTDGVSTIVVQFYAKGANKSQVTIDRRKLKNTKEVEGVKEYWMAALEKLKALLEGDVPLAINPQRGRRAVRGK